MWSWRRLARLAIILGGGIACVAVGQPVVGGSLIAAGVGLALDSEKNTKAKE